MYHLNCPSCSNLTESPFVRSGAVVRCHECQHKYRIKSSHFERVVLTGPRTLDETDSVLRSDSVDIDPDEVSPVSIDDDGNVVGLSGLSELMRWSDTQGSKEKLQSRVDAEPPQAKVPTAKAVARGKAADSESMDPVARVRARAQTRKRKRQNTVLIIGGLGLLLLISIGVIVAMVLSGSSKTPPAEAAEPTGPQSQGPPEPRDASPGSSLQDPRDRTPRNGDESRRDPEIQDNDPVLFDNPDAPSRAQALLFIPPWADPEPGELPEDVPAVLTPSTQVVYEGWYVMRPPRGSANAVGEAEVQLGELTPTPLDEDQTLLVGAVSNRSSQTVLSGELHVMLLDSTGSVFAETYTPLVMIEPGGEQSIAMPIPTRHWQRHRGVRAGVNVFDWIEVVSPLEGVLIDPVGSGESAAVRVSVRNQGDKPLRNVLIVIEASDEQGESVARFVVGEENLYVSPGGWLDLVIATPLEQWQRGVSWTAMIQPR